MKDNQQLADWPNFMTCDQAGSYTNTSERFMRRLASERRIKVCKMGKHVRIERATLDQWIAANTRQAV